MAYLWRLVMLILISLSLTGSAYAGVAYPDEGTSSGTSPGGMEMIFNSSPSLKERILDLQLSVHNGAKYAKDNPKKAALSAFNDQAGKFAKGEQYLFAYDYNGTTLALPYQQELIGKSRMDLTDANGMGFMKTMIALAKSGGGYLYYTYPNPAQNRADQVKITYVEPVDETWFVGAGIYIPRIQAVLSKDAISELVARVKQGAAFAEKEGKVKASAAFNDRNGTWSKDKTYIFAYDYNGTTLAMPYQPESIGTNRWNYTDTYGSPIVRLEIDTAKSGGGFVYVVYNNPETGKDELKLCYILPIREDWLVGSGIYLGEIGE